MINILKDSIGIESDWIIEIHSVEKENVLNSPPYYEFTNYYRKNRPKKDINDFDMILYTTAYYCVYNNLVIFAEENAFSKRSNPTVHLRAFNYIMLNFRATYY